MITDLDLLLPIDKIKFTGAVDKVEYIIDLFIPVAVSLKIQQLQDIDLKTQTNKDFIDLQTSTLEAFLTAQNQHMTEEWIKENISFPYQNFLYLKIVEELGKGNDIKKIEELAAKPI